MKRFSFGVAALALAFAVLPNATAQSIQWGLHSNDRVVFYGDSITEQHFYTWWVEIYAATRFPSQHVQFWNAGVGGDRVTGGFGGTVDLRLQRDVYSHKPTVVTVMLGMNDGSYTPLTDPIEHTYTEGYEHILRSIHEHAPLASILTIGPSPYDDVTRADRLFPGGYNSTMVRFGVIDHNLALKNEAAFTDANTPFTEALTRAVKEDPLAARLLVPDRVHPDMPAHLLIALAVLRGLHAPALVSSTVLDAAQMTVGSGTQNAQVKDLRRTGEIVSWESLEGALPLPLMPGNAAFDYVKRIAPLTQELNQQRLTISSLMPGSYLLRIDDSAVGTFTATQFAAGINLAELDTPMLRQAQNVGWDIRDKSDLQFVRTRTQIRGAPASLDDAEQKMQDFIWHDASPVPHSFRLEPSSRH